MGYQHQPLPMSAPEGSAGCSQDGMLLWYPEWLNKFSWVPL